MLNRVTLALGIVLSLAAGSAYAQTTSDTRNPITGDPGTKVMKPRARPTTARAKALTAADKQGADTTNGNQPDRASAAGGGR